MEDEHPGAEQDEADEREDDDLLRPDPVVEQAEEHRRHPGDHVGHDTEDDDLAELEAEGDRSEDPAEGEHAGEAVTEQGGGDEEEDGVRGGVPQAPDGGDQFPVGADHAERRDPMIGPLVLHGDEERDGEQQRPCATDQHRDPHVGGGEIGSEHGDDQQQDRDATQIAEAPAETADPSHVARGRDLVDGRVVVDVGDLLDDVAACEQDRAKPEVLRRRRHEVHGGGDDREGPRLPAQIEHASTPAVRPLSEHRREECDEDACDGGGPGQLFGALVRVAEGVADQVDGEDEGGDDARERLGAPVPQRPREHLALGGLGRGECCGRRRCGGTHALNLTGRRAPRRGFGAGIGNPSRGAEREFRYLLHRTLRDSYSFKVSTERPEEVHMRIGSSIALIVIGAILAFAINAEVPYISLDLIGYILIAAGVIGLIWSLLASNRSRVSESRTVQDPNTGETVRRTETRDGI